jgi:biotin transporter BioY
MMVCNACDAQNANPTAPRQAPVAIRIPMCDQCGAAIVMLTGLALGVGRGTLSQLARFGLSITGEPLLELKREGT